MGSVVSNMYGGLQYMMSCGGDNQTFPDNGRSSLAATPFVWKRTSSMYFDEDGDLAHEFYEEVKPNKKGKKYSMKKVTRRLLPQGLVDLPYPRLNVDFPVVMCEAY
ncbi:tumor suppressor candidate 2-like [Pocillopora verrucosa]|uniref:Tumor suppressor candidate 2 n=1 Tax=Pocillopora damicornis TaxID=46731 RepID=A0A3M6TFX0_POCDA|nr:tumor suppressor candidate 2-like [Pocillopora damicornis]XP_058955092.1 tumor suppressor candidate 2-like [Pocillopora verrucosa]RMX40297.1 hypothetical protein pdam_00008722 [Pocillopora damicornis]